MREPRILYITCSACLDAGKQRRISKPVGKAYTPIAKVVCLHCLKEHN